jgi:hypothetical protein
VFRYDLIFFAYQKSLHISNTPTSWKRLRADYRVRCCCFVAGCQPEGLHRELQERPNNRAKMGVSFGIKVRREDSM